MVGFIPDGFACSSFLHHSLALVLKNKRGPVARILKNKKVIRKKGLKWQQKNDGHRSRAKISQSNEKRSFRFSI